MCRSPAFRYFGHRCPLKSDDPHPAAGRKLDLDDASTLWRWWGHRPWLRRNRYRIECRWNLRPLTELLAPAEQLAGVDRRVFLTEQEQRSSANHRIFVY